MHLVFRDVTGKQEEDGGLRGAVRGCRGLSVHLTTVTTWVF